MGAVEQQVKGIKDGVDMDLIAAQMDTIRQLTADRDHAREELATLKATIGEDDVQRAVARIVDNHNVMVKACNLLAEAEAELVRLKEIYRYDPC